MMADEQFQFIDKNSNEAPAVTWSADSVEIKSGNSSSAFSSMTLIRIAADDDCMVSIEDSSSPRTRGTRVFGGVPEHVFVPSGYIIRSVSGAFEYTVC